MDGACRRHGREKRLIQISVKESEGKASLREHRHEWENNVA
jgi:hypothetical protein